MVQPSLVFDRAGADGASGIGAAGGLGEAEEGFLLAAQHRVEVGLLLLGRRLVELGEAGGAEDAVAGHVEAGAMLAHLDGEQNAGRHVDAGAAELGRNVEAVEAHRLDLGDEALAVLGRQLAGVGIELVLKRHDLLAHETADLGDDGFLLFRGLEVHCGDSCGAMSERAEAAEGGERLADVAGGNAAVVVDVEHEQLLIPGGVLLVDLDAELGGA